MTKVEWNNLSYAESAHSIKQMEKRGKLLYVTRFFR